MGRVLRVFPLFDQMQESRPSSLLLMAASELSNYAVDGRQASIVSELYNSREGCYHRSTSWTPVTIVLNMSPILSSFRHRQIGLIGAHLLFPLTQQCFVCTVWDPQRPCHRSRHSLCRLLLTLRTFASFQLA